MLKEHISQPLTASIGQPRFVSAFDQTGNTHIIPGRFVMIAILCDGAPTGLRSDDAMKQSVVSSCSDMQARTIQVGVNGRPQLKRCIAKIKHCPPSSDLAGENCISGSGSHLCCERLPSAHDCPSSGR